MLVYTFGLVKFTLKMLVIVQFPVKKNLATQFSHFNNFISSNCFVIGSAKFKWWIHKKPNILEHKKIRKIRTML
jgi:hypothetical protein